jgi:hypothetical protein
MFSLIIKNRLLRFIIITNLINLINAHSWISCTNYEIDNPYNYDYLTQSITYDLNKCQGFSRNYNLQYESDKNRGFGFDTGYNHRGIECNANYQSFYYNNQLKMAKYSPGQQICLTYPSKNHVSSQCTNIYIPENGMKISRSINKLTDDFSKEYQHLNGIHQPNSIDYKGFQNCPGFCNNTDKTVCYVCFNLENNIDSGIYSFKWTWQFNQNEFYSTCWDAEIINSNPASTINTNSDTTTNTNNLDTRPTPNNIDNANNINNADNMDNTNNIDNVDNMDNTNNMTNTNNITDNSDCGDNRNIRIRRLLNNIDYRYNKNTICTNSPSISISNSPSNSPPNSLPNSPPNSPSISPPNSPSNSPPNSPSFVPLPQPISDNNHKKCKEKNKNGEKKENEKENKQEEEKKDEKDNYSDKKYNNSAKVWEQCGGKDIENKDCIDSKCIKYSPYYSQCLPNKLEKNALCGQNDNQEINWKYDVCINNLKCLPMPGSMDFRCI